ncbi:PAS domain-containing sensor histidine kinase [Arcobacter suis]|uniref:histidine kinase n=1 Tax=Arcobacter suis CECT 7833 TaxID=663365 RepID=A0AAD0SQ69_9BACT|nr:PAS domain-containing sensor histidine kinase [Arcobacter suis]AXX89044.1 PAS sensor-containing two-component system histidine kinase [Arcobacter suis CECT 7833]RWS47951.1 PAS domain-containing sensor histidine kinase [Arcobacter suis]
MRVSFYIKLFLAFIVFAILLLGFSSFAFNNFYKLHNQKKEKENIINILKHQENSFKSYVKSFDEKLFLLSQKNFLEIQDKEKALDLFKKILFNNENILEFKVVSLDAQEIIKVTNNSGNIKIIKDEKLQNIYSNSYYKDIRTLKEQEIWHVNSDLEKPNIINFILREKNYFLILKVDFSNFFANIYNNFDKKTLVISDNNSVVNGENKNFEIYKNELNNIKKDDAYLTNEFISKKTYLNENKYFIFIVNIEQEVNNNYFQEYYKSIIIIGLILSVILSLLFSKPIAKLNKKIEDENKNLDLSIKKSFIELNENQKVIDKHIMFIRMSKNNVILEVSSAFCYFLGFSKGELIGHDYKMLIHKDTKKKEYIKLWKFVKEGKSYVGEIKGIKKDGESFWVDLFVEPNFDNLKQIVGYTIITYDTTNKKKIEDLYKNINNQVEQYNAIFENVNSGIALIDLEGNFKKINSTFSKFLKYKDEELFEMKCIDIVPENSKELLSKILKEAREIGTISNIEKIFVKKYGTLIHLELSLSLLSDKKHFVFVVNSLEDKRKLQELNQNLELRINQEVEKSIQKDKIHQQEQIKNAKLTSIGSLAAGIAHEINTPLTYIKGNLELMEYDIFDLPQSEIQERMKQDSEKIKEGINRIANIVESMREMSQSSKEIKEETNIYATLITSLTMAYNRSRQVSRIYLNGKLFDIDSINKNEYKYLCKIQKQRIEQVWIIVINNALDELVKIDDYENRVLNINIFEENNEVIIRFKDSAGGINKEIINEIFEPFISSKVHSGMGVGLNIAKKIIDEQDGIIRAYNEDFGAVFEIRLQKYEEE